MSASTGALRATWPPLFDIILMDSPLRWVYSYYRIRDLKTGVVLRNITESCNHSFGSAFVDSAADGTLVLASPRDIIVIGS